MAGIFGLLMSGAGVIKDQYFNLTSLLLPGNGTDGKQNRTFKDSSVNDFLITPNGNTTQGTFSPFSQTGWGNYFNGSSYLLSTATQVIPTGSFTVEAWAYPTVSTDGYIVAQGTTGNAARFSVGIESNAWYVQIGATRVSSSAAPVINRWTYIAVTFNGSTLTLYVDGQSVGTPQPTTTSAQNATLRIGSLGPADWAALYWTGYISSVRISNTVRSISVPTTPTPFTADANTTFLGCNINRFQYTTSAGGFTSLTTGGSPSVTPFSPFAPTQSYSASAVGGSGYFDGTGDYLTVGYNANLQLGSSDFTIDFWFYSTGAQGSGDVLANGYTSGTNLNWLIQADVSTVKFYASTNGTAWAVSALTVGTIVHNQWNHFCVTRSGTTVTPYLNGTAGTTGSLTGSVFSNSSGIAIATDNSSPGTLNIQGYLSDFRIIIGSAVAPPSGGPTSPATAVTNTKLLLNFTNGGVIDATAKNVLETVGNAQISTTQSKWGGGSMYFDGSSSFARAPATPNYFIGSGDFTVELWLKRAATGSVQELFSKESATASQAGIRCVILSGNTIQVSLSTNGIAYALTLTGATALTSTSDWYYIALVRSGSGTNNIKLYVNGSVDAQGTFASALYETNTFWALGSRADLTTNTLNGYIDDFRVTIGQARTITSAPTAPFPLQ